MVGLLSGAPPALLPWPRGAVEAADGAHGGPAAPHNLRHTWSLAGALATVMGVCSAPRGSALPRGRDGRACGASGCRRLHAVVPGSVQIRPRLSPPALPVDCDQSCARGLAVTVGCRSVPSVPIPCAATREKPRGRFPFSTFPLTRRPGEGGGSCTTGWEPPAHPETCLVRAASTHPPSEPSSPACPAPRPRVTACLCAATASSRGTLRHTSARTLAATSCASSCPSPSAGLAGPRGSGCGCPAGMAPCLLSPCPIPGMGSVGL